MWAFGPFLEVKSRDRYSFSMRLVVDVLGKYPHFGPEIDEILFGRGRLSPRNDGGGRGPQEGPRSLSAAEQAELQAPADRTGYTAVRVPHGGRQSGGPAACQNSPARARYKAPVSCVGQESTNTWSAVL